MAPLTPLLSAAGAHAWLESAKRMNGRLRHRLLGPLAIVWLVITVASVVIGAVSWNRLSHTIDVSSEAIQFRECMNQLFWSLQDAETSQRDYLLTGKESFSDSFRNIEKTFPNAFDRLAEFAMHDRLRRKDLFELRAAIELKLVELRQSMALAREKGFNRAAAVVNSP